MQIFLDRLMEAAKASGIEAAEAYISEQDSFSARSNKGEITEYKSNTKRGLGFRGLKNGRMGYASTEAFDDEAIGQLIKGVLESAELCEDTDTEFLYDGKGEVPELVLHNPKMDDVTATEKLELLLKTEKIAKEYDEKIDNVGYNMMTTGKHTVRIANTYGMDRSFTENVCMLMTGPIAKDGDSVSSGYYGKLGRDFDQLDAQAVASEAAQRAIDGLHAKSLPSGKYRVIMHHETMASLLEVFAKIFSAETAQKGLSLLKGKLGECIAAPCVTLVDDPLLATALEARPFDAEGVPSKAHTVIENGVFKTFLHNLKTAYKDGVETTGNAAKAGYSSSVYVSPSNFYFKAGTKSFDALLKSVSDGVVITEVSGLHAGANAVSGDFSLLSKGYTIKDGVRDQAVEQITVAGNYYELLSSIRAFADDLTFPEGGIGCPSADVGELSISGS